MGDGASVEVAYVGGMARTSDGTVWVSDPVLQQVVSYDPQEPTSIGAPTGDGPGEVRSPSLLAPDPSGGYALYDARRNSVDRFRADATFIERIQLSREIMNPKGLLMLDGGSPVLSGGIAGNEHALHLFGTGGDLERSWSAIDSDATNPRARLMVSGGPLAGVPGGVLYSQAAPHLLVRYTFGADGGIAADTIAADPDLLPSIGDDFIQEGNGRRTFRWSFPQSRVVYPLADGRIVNVVHDGEAGRVLWEVYDPDGSAPPLRSAWTSTDELGIPWGFDPTTGETLVALVDPTTDVPRPAAVDPLAVEP